MSGGIIQTQYKGDHQVVIFTFAGELKADKVKAWNDEIRRLKAQFGSQVMGVTIKGEHTEG